MRAAIRQSIRWFAVFTLALPSMSVTRHASPASTSLTAAGTSTHRSVTFTERVAAQEAIERVYLRHRIGALPATDAPVRREVLERKVRTYLGQSAALELLWRQPVTAEALRGELERIAWDTRFPDRLQEIYDALGRDSVLIQECFARPVLVDRIARSFQALDPSMHREARREIDDLAARLLQGDLDAIAPHARRQRVVLERVDGAERPGARPGGEEDPSVLRVSSAEFARLEASVPSGMGRVGPVREERDAFVVTVALSYAPDRSELAVYRVPKVGWEEWLDGVRPRLHPDGVSAVAHALERLPMPRTHDSATTEATDACLPDDTWNNRSLDDFPEGRTNPAAVWTGAEMIVWGGEIRSGARYDPLLDHWTLLSRTGAPTATGPAVWTGSEMIVWPSSPGEIPGRYTPGSDTWQPVSLVGAPAAGSSPAVAWVANRVVVWEAVAMQGGRYDPNSDSWAPMSTLGAPSARLGHASVGIGSRLLIWGGSAPNFGPPLNTGGRYDPAADVWTPTTTSSAPAGGGGYVAVWTGSRAIVWSALSTGGVYDPAFDAWTAMSTVGQPSPRTSETAVWAGTRMIVWGGTAGGQPFNDGGRYDPATNTWTPTSIAGAAARRERHAAVWTGTQMIVWGGQDGMSLDSGGRYDPVADAWTPSSQGSAPQARSAHAAVWTGSEMVIWGGRPAGNTGGRYDPVTDSWTSTALAGAPANVEQPIAFWTGHYLLVYSGYEGSATGGRYNPATDTWSPVASTAAPAGWLIRPTATWTGNRMFVIGVRNADDEDVAAFYNPESDVWTPISLAGAPYIPLRGTVVWTGTRAILFGGSNGSSSGWPGLGSMFDVNAGTWSTISQVGEPAPRVDHEAVWTGDRMLVWGGSQGSGAVAGGGLYDPITDHWTPITQPASLPPTHDHSALWTGDRLIVWGGSENWQHFIFGPSSQYLDKDTGAIYDPATDAWAPTDVGGAPAPRSWHSAVWTGGEMLVWGGSETRTGGAYALGQSDDRDGDGVSVCAGDCDDADPAVHPGSAEVCDGRDNNCDGVSLPAEAFDADLDLSPACGDCDDANPGRYPGALEYCDGLDNNCNGAIDETDSDGDGDSCATDCDELDPETFTGAPESNDGRDNQCPGDPGFGMVDEVSGSLAFPSGTGQLCWPAQAGATLYEVLRASSGAMTSGCVMATTPSACFTDPATPVSHASFSYLVRALQPNVGSWGVTSSGTERVGLCTTAYSFTDTAGDDVPASSLQQFLSGITVLSGDYLKLSLHGSGIDFDLCTARADFYRGAYLGLAPTAGVSSSGSWQKWHRTGAGPWVGPVLDPFENWFGDDCAGPFSWCAEVGLGGHTPGVAPPEIGVCEAFDDITCGDGSWTFTLRIGLDRLAACGF